MNDEELNYQPKPKMDETHRRNVVAAKIMDDEEAAKLWDFICGNFWDVARIVMIEPEEPD